MSFSLPLAWEITFTFVCFLSLLLRFSHMPCAWGNVIPLACLLQVSYTFCSRKFKHLPIESLAFCRTSLCLSQKISVLFLYPLVLAFCKYVIFFIFVGSCGNISITGSCQNLLVETEQKKGKYRERKKKDQSYCIHDILHTSCLSLQITHISHKCFSWSPTDGPIQKPYCHSIFIQQSKFSILHHITFILQWENLWIF